MTIIVAVPDSPEGQLALSTAVAEAETFHTDLVVVNLALHPIDISTLDTDVPITVVDRHGRHDRDPVEVVLDEIADCKADRLVVGVKRRTPIGKVVVGSVSQQLLLTAPIPVLAVKLDVDN